jgi:SAM-dependent methyltransferase
VLRDVDCAACGSAGRTVVYHLPGDDLGPRTVVACGQCGLWFVSPRISSGEIADKYAGRSYFERKSEAMGYQNYLEDRDLHLLFFRRQLDELERLVNRGRLLDVGCAGGFLVQEAVRRGWQAEGVEVSEFASAHARDVLGLTVRTGDLRGAAYPDNHFRVVVMDDVIEHFEDPLVESREVFRILEPGGLFVLHTPNAASPWRHLMGSKWVHLKPDEHLYYFDPATIGSLLARAGFADVQARACSKATNVKYIAGVAGKVIPAATSVAEALLGRTVLWTRPFPFRGGGMQVVARKPPVSR